VLGVEIMHHNTVHGMAGHAGAVIRVKTGAKVAQSGSESYVLVLGVFSAALENARWGLKHEERPIKRLTTVPIVLDTLKCRNIAPLPSIIPFSVALSMFPTLYSDTPGAGIQRNTRPGGWLGGCGPARQPVEAWISNDPGEFASKAGQSPAQIDQLNELLKQRMARNDCICSEHEQPCFFPKLNKKREGKCEGFGGLFTVVIAIGYEMDRYR